MSADIRGPDGCNRWALHLRCRMVRGASANRDVAPRYSDEWSSAKNCSSSAAFKQSLTMLLQMQPVRISLSKRTIAGFAVELTASAPSTAGEATAPICGARAPLGVDGLLFFYRPMVN